MPTINPQLTEEKSSEIFDTCHKLGMGIQEYADAAPDLFRQTLEAVAEGRIIAALDEKKGGYRELSCPPFDVVRMKSKMPPRKLN